jgi:hypothetical protein
MGLKDRLTVAKRWMWSPMTIWMADQDSDELVRAGEPARVVVDVRGEDDGTQERLEVWLQMTGLGYDGKCTWRLGELPVALGKQELEVMIPIEVAPACAKYAEYTFQAELFRSKGTNSTAGKRVDVVGRPEDLYWPEGPRSGSEGPDDVRVTIALQDDAVVAGGTVSGQVTLFAAQPVSGDHVELEFGPLVDTLVQVAGKNQPQQRARFKATTEIRLASKPSLAQGESLELPFSVEVPAGLPPTLHNGGLTSVVWQVRVRVGKASAWATVGVLDPEALAGTRNEPSPSLLAWLGSLDTGR